MRLVYSGVVRCLAPLAFAVVLWRALRDPAYRPGLWERFGWGVPAPAPTVWFHAVSLGEMSAAAPLIRAFRARHPTTPVVVTTATPAGRARARALFSEDVDIRYLPYDVPGSVRRFVRRIRPQCAIIMETELWPMLFDECARRRIPVLLASARLSAKSVGRYRRFPGLLRETLSANVRIAAQSELDARRFESIGASASRVCVVGNVKFDQGADPLSRGRGRELRGALGTRPVWIAGSTHAGEEELILEAHRALLADRPEALLLLAPRHKNRFESVAALLERGGWRFVRRSGGAVPALDSTVWLIDTLGELTTLYAAADVAFVGGSLVPVGGHSLLEPAALALPVLAGPHQFNNPDIARIMLAQGAALPVVAGRGNAGATDGRVSHDQVSHDQVSQGEVSHDQVRQGEVSDSAVAAAVRAEPLDVALRRLIDDPAARRRMGQRGGELIAANQGAVARLMELIDSALRGVRP
jgi:3-deoxy-D-manno-octulosonic-acid transferase